jgi:hypothetical protein
VEYLSPRASGGGRVWGAYCQDYTIYLGVIDGQSGQSVLAPGLSVRSDRGWTRSMLYFGLIYGPPGHQWFGFGGVDVGNVDALFRGDLLGWKGVRVRALMIPAWFILSLTVLPPAAWTLQWWRQRRRSRRNLCRRCGYELAGNVSGVCPECGTGV